MHAHYSPLRRAFARARKPYLQWRRHWRCEASHLDSSVLKSGKMSSQLIWQLINKHNSFKVKGRTGNRVVLSAEPGNLFGKHSYKYSGRLHINSIDVTLRSRGCPGSQFQDCLTPLNTAYTADPSVEGPSCGLTSNGWCYIDCAQRRAKGLTRCATAGLANDRTIDIQPGKEGGVVITTKRSKNKSKPSSATTSYTTKKSTRRAAAAIGKEARKIRPDLKVLIPICHSHGTKPL